MRKLLQLVLLIGGSLTAMAQAPQIPLSGNIGTGFNGPLINSPNVVFATDADHTMVYPEMSGSSGALIVTSTVSLTATRNLIVPGTGRFVWPGMRNNTTGGQDITVKVSGGTGVTIANGAVATVLCDQVNCYAPTVSGGTTSVSATSPIRVNGGAGPEMGAVTLSCPGCGSVTALSSLTLGTLFSTSIANPNTTPFFTFSLFNAPAYSVWGNFTGSVGQPSYGSVNTAMLPFTYVGNTSLLPTASGSFINGDCVTINASLNFVDAGAPCGTGSGTGSPALPVGSLQVAASSSTFGSYVASGLVKISSSSPTIAVQGTDYQGAGVSVVTGASSITLDGNTGSNFTVTLATNVTTVTLTNFVTNQFYVLRWSQDGTGGHTCGNPTSGIGFSGCSPDPNAKTDYFAQYDGTNLVAQTTTIH